MKQLNHFLILITLIFFGCESKDEKTVEREIVKTHPFPTVIDTLGIDTTFYKTEEKFPTWLSSFFYELYYIGSLKDSIYLNNCFSSTIIPIHFLPLTTSTKNESTKKKVKSENIFQSYFVDWDKDHNYLDYSSAKIEIQFDAGDLKNFALPVMLTNLNSDTIIIGNTNFIPLIIEAKDRSGKWRPIQKHPQNLCGTGVSSIILPPNEIVITLAPKFEGDYKTKLRFTIGNNHSKEFDASINYRQFKSRFNEQGDYCEEYKREMKKSKL